MEFTDYLWLKLIVVAVGAFIWGLLGFTDRSPGVEQRDKSQSPRGPK